MSEEQKTPQEYWKDYPEAPFSTTFKWVDANGFEQMTTIRGWAFLPMFQSVQKAEAVILENGGKPSTNPRTAQPAPAPTEQKVQLKTEDGLPVVNQDGEPVMVALPDGVHIFKVAGLFHGKTQNGKDFLGVRTVEGPYNNKWGVKCFHPNGINGWKTWQVGESEPLVYAPPDNAKVVLIREPKEQGKYADVIEFRAA